MFNVDPKATHAKVRTLLAQTTQQGNLEMVEFLHKSKADRSLPSQISQRTTEPVKIAIIPFT